jgi:hypothetical protein
MAIKGVQSLWRLDCLICHAVSWMSMYVHLLSAALENFSHADCDDPLGDAIADLVRLGDRFGEHQESGESSRGTADFLAGQLAHDVALIEVSRYYGIRCAPSDFGDPTHKRASLLAVLRTYGIMLEHQGVLAHGEPDSA